MRVDMDARGTPVGLEITAPGAVTMKQLSGVLAKLGVPLAQMRDAAKPSNWRLSARTERL